MKKLKININKKSDKTKIKKTKKIDKKKSFNIDKGKVIRWIISIILLLGIAFVTLLLAFALYIIISAPDFEQKKLYSKEATVLYYKDGTEITRMGRQNRTLVSYNELPQVLVDAIIATEDSRFFQHTGLDIARFAKASFGQLLGQKEAGGASTLSMQVIKQTYTSSNAEGLDGIIRKFTDIYMSIFKLESNYTKEEILEFYVNSITFGNDGNLNYEVIAGIEQACIYYFDKSVSEITLAEASIIAGMFQNPRLYNPYKYPQNVAKRQDTVLKLMVLHDYITEEEKEAVQKIPVQSLVADRSQEKATPNQAIIDYAVQEVQEKTGLDPLTTPLEIYTTFDPKVQNVLTQLENGELYEFPYEKIQEGVAITNIEDGSIVAMSGGLGYQARGLNRAVDIKRHPGSTAKPIFDYAPYIEYLNGSTYTMFLDEPTTYSNGTPIKNADSKYMGLITMKTALTQSRNIPALRAFQALNNADKNYIPDFVHSLGIDYGDELYESAAIGGFDGVNPLQMSAAYAAFGRKGNYIKPYSYTKVVVRETGKTYEHKYEKENVMSEGTAYMITDILKNAASIGIAGLRVSGTDLAAKTGTSTIDKSAIQKYGVPADSTMDAWNITYNPEYSIALWIGYDKLEKGHKLNLYSGDKIRKAVMKVIGSKIYSKNKTFDQPSGVVKSQVELETYPPQLPSLYTPSDKIITEYFKAGTEPTEVSPRYDKLQNPSNGKYSLESSGILLTWDPAPMPDYANQDYLQEHFNKYYENQASNYFNKRLEYNKAYVGGFGYNIYYKDATGTLVLLGRSENNTYTVNSLPVAGIDTFVVKTAYSIFGANMSDGITIKTTGTSIPPQNNDDGDEGLD